MPRGPLNCPFPLPAPPHWLKYGGAVWFAITVWVTPADVLVKKFPLPAYTAVNVWLVTERLEVVNVATPPFRVATLIVAAPSLNVRVPVAELGDTLAVSVTCWPDPEGLMSVVNTVVVVPVVTVCVNGVE